MKVCKSINIEVLETPEIFVDPPSATLFRGGSIQIRCIAEKVDNSFGTLGYSWTKNHALFQSEPEQEIWEDLYPEGSILKIKNIHKSAIYSCTISSAIGPVSRSVQITVVDEDAITLCPKETSFGIKWPATTSGPAVLAKCPNSFRGNAQRICEQRDYKMSRWLMADFSDCINQDLSRVYDEVCRFKHFYSIEAFVQISLNLSKFLSNFSQAYSFPPMN